METVPESKIVVVVGPPLPSPPLSQTNPGWHPLPPPPPPLAGEDTVTDCSAPVTVTVALACVPPLGTDEARALASPGSSTLISRPRASLHVRRCLPASSVVSVQLPSE